MLAALPSPSSATFCSTWIRVHTLRTQLVTDTTAITVPGSDAHNQPKHKDRPFRSQMIMRPTPPGIRPVLPRAPWAYTTATHPPVGHCNALTRHAERTNRRALDRLDSLICNHRLGQKFNPQPSQNNANFSSNSREKSSDSGRSEGCTAFISVFSILQRIPTHPVM